mmetsp:Transcript_38220/g.102612  ORF Transcript_38220/g.102612 Transcript_38220/m.102612 type:complete len:230 (+) Transcript_38220:1535-2224(+)
MSNAGLRGHHGHGSLPSVHDVADGADLDGIPQCRARAVALRNADVVQADSWLALLYRPPDAVLLGGPVRGGHAGALPVLVGAAADETRERRLQVLLALAHPHHDRAAALAPRVAVGARVEGEAPAPLAQHGRGGVLAVEPRVEEQPHTHGHACLAPGAHVGPAATSLPERRVQQVRGDQPGRAGRVHNVAGADEPQHMVEPRAGDAVAHTFGCGTGRVGQRAAPGAGRS